MIGSLAEREFRVTPRCWGCMVDVGIEHWARETFGAAELGDPRRTERLVRMAEAAARRPAGTITSVMQTSAEAEGAFRFLESSRVETAAVGAAVFSTTALSALKRQVSMSRWNKRTLRSSTERKYVDLGQWERIPARWIVESM